jgi:hypothetical protein
LLYKPIQLTAMLDRKNLSSADKSGEADGRPMPPGIRFFDRTCQIIRLNGLIMHTKGARKL